MSVAAVFSGQGAQFVGMGKDLADAFPECAALYERADEVLGFSLSKLCFEGPDEELTRSNNCQPAIFVTSLACYTAWTLKGGDVTPTAVAGLSLGEWTALHVAGVLSFEDTLKVLEARGRFMQEACEEQAGGMISIIGLDRAGVEIIAAEAGVTVANLNSAQQIVLSGPKAAIARAEALANEAGAKRAVVLNVAGAFHSPLMASAATKLAGVLETVTFQEPTLPVLSNVTGAPHADAAAIPGNMLGQVTDSVLWLSCVEWLTGQGVGTVVECGPGKVLTGLIKRIARDVTLCNIQDVPTLEKTVATLG